MRDGAGRAALTVNLLEARGVKEEERPHKQINL
jgi:hypothetical protein